MSSTIAAGTIRSIDASDAKKALGVLAVLSHLNAPKLNSPQPPQQQQGQGQQQQQQQQQQQPGQSTNFNEVRLIPFADGTIHYLGQHIAVVVADTFEQAQHGASLVKITYDAQPARIDLAQFRGEAKDRSKSAFSKGDADTAFESFMYSDEHCDSAPPVAVAVLEEAAMAGAGNEAVVR